MVDRAIKLDSVVNPEDSQRHFQPPSSSHPPPPLRLLHQVRRSYGRLLESGPHTVLAIIRLSTSDSSDPAQASGSSTVWHARAY